MMYMNCIFWAGIVIVIILVVLAGIASWKLCLVDSLETFSNSCFACMNAAVFYWTEGSCN